MDHGLPGYVLHQRIGVGANAEVFRAEPVGSPGRVVAVKRLRTEADTRAVDDLRREADALARLSHPSILRLIDVVTDGGRIALVVPFAVGGSLADRLAITDGGLAPVEVADLGARIARALAAAHNAGLVHRDVKPGNVLFDAEGQPLLGDFGTAHLTADQAPVAGTAEYTDPEVLAGAPASVRSDLYGLGVTLYEALTGVPPYAGSTARQTLAAADRGVHAPLADLVDAPDALADTIERAMARDPRSRPATATDLAADLDEVRRQLEAASAELPAPPPPPRPGSAGVLGALPADTQPTSPRHHRPSDAGARTDPEQAHAGPERSGTVTFGPAPPRAPERSPSARGLDRRLIVLAAILALAVPLGLVWWLTDAAGDEVELALDAPDDADPDPEQVDGRDAEVDPSGGDAQLAPCDPESTPEAGPDVEVLVADVEGRGCTVPVTWDGRQLTVPLEDGSVERYDLAAASDDVLLLGDWSCDGRATPALYRPEDGQLFVFDEFSEDATVRGERSGVVGGTPVVVSDEHGCQHVRVEVTP
jgi:eukaryotic-like serine/threonine-protein kinase